MAKTNVETPEIEVMGEVAMTKTETFFEENGKKVAMAILGVIVVASAIFGYKSLVIDPTEERASEAMFYAQAIFDGATPDFETALNGDAEVTGFLEVIENYGSTKAGNLAKHYAGVCYVKLGDNANAVKYLTQYKAQKSVPAQIINAQNLGLQGDVAVNEKQYSKAVGLYTAAANAANNILTAPLFLRKAAQAAIAAGDTAQAKSLLDRISTEYPQSSEYNTAEKYMGGIE
ncbi:MAG: tetratricopeptide repeat protein [Rikenellaceae bacterium]